MRIALSLILVFLFIVASPNMSAANVPGCREDVRAAAEATAEARVAGDVAANEEISNQPDSVHALTCSDQAFRVSSSEGGGIFSGDFTSEMNEIVQDPLQNIISNNFIDSIGNSTEFADVVGNYLSDFLGNMLGGGGSFDCPVMQDLYDAYLTTGTNKNVPYLTLEEMIAASSGGDTSNKFLMNLAAEWGPGGVFENLVAARNALPANTIPSAAGAVTFDDVLSAVGILP